MGRLYPELRKTHHLSDNFATSLEDIKSASDPRFRQSIDYTLLKPDATLEHIAKLCEEAVNMGSR